METIAEVWLQLLTLSWRVVQNINVTLEQWNKEICGGLITYDRSCLEGGKKHELTFETVE